MGRVSDTSGEMITFVNARLAEAHAAAATDEQRRYVLAMSDIVLLWDDIEPGYREAVAAGDLGGIAAAARARWAAACAIGFIASVREDHPDFRPEWKP